MTEHTVRRVALAAALAGLALLAGGPARSPRTAAAQHEATVITIRPPLRYGGHEYTVRLRVRGSAPSSDAATIFYLTEERLSFLRIDALNVFRDGRRITDQDEIRHVLLLYSAAHVLYTRRPPAIESELIGDLETDLERLLGSPLVIGQRARALFKTPEDESLEALRGILTARARTAEVDAFATDVRQRLEAGEDFAAAIDAVSRGATYSNIRRIREIARDTRSQVGGWARRTGAAPSVRIEGHDVELTNAIELATLIPRLLYASALGRERAALLAGYERDHPTGPAALVAYQAQAARAAHSEAESAWNRRGHELSAFVREKAGDLIFSQAADWLAREWVKHSWAEFGTRIVGHEVASAASGVGIGYLAATILFGLDGVYDNFTVAKRAEELRQRFSAGRMALQERVSPVQSHAFYDGELVERYRRAYLLETLAGIQTTRAYAAGLASAYDKGWIELINPLSWIDGTAMRESIERFQDVADEREAEIEGWIGEASRLGALAVFAGGAGVDDPPPGGSRISTATVMLLDVSSSMNEDDPSGITKIDGAQDAARRITRMVANESRHAFADHQLGLVGFGDQAQVLQAPTTDFAAVESAIEQLSAFGITNMAAGLDSGMELLDPLAGIDRRIVVLLSDGVPTAGGREGWFVDHRQEIREDFLPVLPRVADCVYVVGLGDPEVGTGIFALLSLQAGVDQEFLQEIAAVTDCGGYYTAATAGQLAASFLRLRHLSAGGDLVVDLVELPIRQGETTAPVELSVPRGATELNVTLDWPGSRLDLNVVDPQGRAVDDTYPGVQRFVDTPPAQVIVERPIVGRWTVFVYGADVPAEGTRYSLIGSVRGTSGGGPRDGMGGLVALVGIAIGAGMVGAIAGSRKPRSKRRRRAAGAVLELLSDDATVTHVEALSAAHITIGRDASSGLRVVDDRVSREHARVERSGDDWTVSDLGSANGTLVNGEPVNAPRALRDGDLIRVGKTRLRFRRG